MFQILLWSWIHVDVIKIPLMSYQNYFSLHKLGNLILTSINFYNLFLWFLLRFSLNWGDISNTQGTVTFPNTSKFVKKYCIVHHSINLVKHGLLCLINYLQNYYWTTTHSPPKSNFFLGFCISFGFVATAPVSCFVSFFSLAV